MSEIQNARGIMDVLAEMLNALDPGNKAVTSPSPSHSKSYIFFAFSTTSASLKLNYHQSYIKQV